jgi:hypothetical protein
MNIYVDMQVKGLPTRRGARLLECTVKAAATPRPPKVRAPLVGWADRGAALGSVTEAADRAAVLASRQVRGPMTAEPSRDN